jgi:hypothetical protein
LATIARQPWDSLDEVGGDVGSRALRCALLLAVNTSFILRGWSEYDEALAYDSSAASASAPQAARRRRGNAAARRPAAARAAEKPLLEQVASNLAGAHVC